MAEVKEINRTSTTAATCAEILREHFGLSRISVVLGGPSASDPMGEIDKYMGFIDTFGNTYFIGVSENGRIVKVGGTVNGRKYELPATERV